MACANLFSVEPAAAHHIASGPPQGLPVPSLSHGELAIVARHRAEIADLAERQLRTDPTFRRLLTYAQVQRLACLWGVMPGSLADEDSPFNECSHAFLSAYKALLVQMVGLPTTPDAARTLLARIERERHDDPDAAALCAFSSERFDTAEIVTPRWTGIPSHAASLLTLLGAMLVALGAAAFMRSIGVRSLTPAA